MTQQELIIALVGTKELDLEVVIKDTEESKVSVEFIALSFEKSSQVAMKLEITTINKDVELTQSGETLAMPPITTTKIIRADERTQIPVVDENNDPLLDNEDNPLTIGEDSYWKYLAWINALQLPVQDLLRNVIMVKFNMIPNELVLQINSADYPDLTFKTEPENQ